MSRFAHSLLLLLLSCCLVRCYGYAQDATQLRPRATSAPPWHKLNRTLHGRLQVAAPFARACFTEAGGKVSGTVDAAACAQVQSAYTDPATRVDVFSAYMNTQWETCQATSAQCLLDFLNENDRVAFSPPAVCKQGSVSPYYIDVSHHAEVQAAFDFSQTYGVPIAIKNSGHDYLGRSSAPHSLGLWMHNLQQISYDASFIPSGCASSEPSQAITMGAGVTQGTLVDFAAANNVLVPTGAERSVAAVGGYLQGGGHSAFSNVYGLAVDRVLEYKVVTPTGKYLTANACRHPDLFFALRGGGGGTFGVVMEATVSAFTQTAFPVALVQLETLTSHTRSLWLRFLINHAVHYAESGWGGYISLQPGAMIFANPLINMTQADHEMQSLRNLLASTVPGTLNLTLEPSFGSFIHDFLTDVSLPVGLPFIVSSRLIPRANFASSVSRGMLAANLSAALAQSSTQNIYAVTPFLFTDDGQTSVTPAWRDAVWHTAVTASWNYNTTLAEKKALYAKVSKAMDPVRALTPGSGAYLNEADVHEPDHTGASMSFWGSNHKRLVAIKRKYDPNHILDCWHCVDWAGPKAQQFECYV